MRSLGNTILLDAVMCAAYLQHPKGTLQIQTAALLDRQGASEHGRESQVNSLQGVVVGSAARAGDVIAYSLGQRTAVRAGAGRFFDEVEHVGFLVEHCGKGGCIGLDGCWGSAVRSGALGDGSPGAGPRCWVRPGSSRLRLW